MQQTKSKIENLPYGDSNLSLAQLASEGDISAREKVNALAHPMITFQSDRFCKRFCAENKYLYRCTLQTPWGNAPNDALLCEWGNASYAWMLNDLTNSHRLQQYKGENGSKLDNYLYHIANSLPFYERWKNWRFGRRINVPEYIKEIDPDAARIFYALRSNESTEIIAQRINAEEQHVDNVAQKIIITLTKRKRLHLLNPEREHSLTSTDHTENDSDTDQAEGEIAIFDPNPEDQEQIQLLRQAWKQLSAVEQFVMEAMIIEQQDANDVLAAIIKLEVQLTPKISPENTDRQQLYYFKRKTLAKLADILQSIQ